jgi:NAD(P)-dependent dehydrogenase (short-subunit alcohol dehydrogenase family)
MKKLEGKVALITGGSSGIGLATAKLFWEEGATVAIAGQTPKALEAAKKDLGGEALVLQADVSKLSDLDRVFSEIKTSFGRIDVLFANAGIAHFMPVGEVSEDFFDRIRDVNVKGLFFTVQKALPLMHKSGAIILTSSSLQQRAMSGGSVYAAGKAAVRSLGRGFAADLAESGIRVNVLTPGPVETPIYGKMGLSAEKAKAMNENMTAHVPIKRVGRPNELAKAALFLACDDSSFVFGSELCTDGGLAQL